MKLCSLLCLITLMLCLTGAALAQQTDRFAKVQITTTKVAGNIYMLEGSGGNIGVSAGPDGIIIVDDQFAPLAEKIRVALKQINPGRLKFVINTHWHGDHTGGNATFGVDAPIIAQTNVRLRLMTDQTVLGEVAKAAAKEALPVLTFDQSVSIHFNGEEIKVIHFPHGHTDGDSVIFFTKSNVVHMGDDFFAGRFPFVDLDSGGDVEQLAVNVGEIVVSLPADVKVIPGHGPISNLDDLKLYQKMLVTTTDIVRKAKSAGKTLDEIKAAGLPKEYDSWGAGFIKTDKWIETVYNSLAKKK